MIGTLANNGVSIAPYHDFDSKIPAKVKTDIETLKAGDHRRNHLRRSEVLPDAAVTPRSAMRLELQGITKRFGDLVANDRIDLTAEEGEIHALLGENGAGKTTLMNVLDGLYRPDEGTISARRQARSFSNPGEAIRAGIGMVHQNFMLIPAFTVAENVMLGFERTTPLRLPRSEARARRDPGALAAIRARGGPRRARRRPLRGPAAARRDREGPRARGPRAHPRRAHGRAHAAGDRGALHGHAIASRIRAAPSSSSPTS